MRMVVARGALVAAAIVLFVAAGFGAVIGAGPPQYPDLRTMRPADLQFDVLADGTRILRFSNAVWNAGPGPLELEGNPDPLQNVTKSIFQNIYDRQGRQVIHRKVSSDIEYHPTHNHYHFTEFASYRLLRQGKQGIYRVTRQGGAKTGFCIMDTLAIASPAGAKYTTCERELQGLSVGWADIYDYTLDDQWLVIPARGLRDGEYALVSTVDPKNKLDEGVGEGNNAATTYFTVSQGEIVKLRNRP
jgi:hypothetical protein